MYLKMLFVMAVCEDCHYMGLWCRGSMAVSKTADGGSNPPGSAGMCDFASATHPLRDELIKAWLISLSAMRTTLDRNI